MAGARGGSRPGAGPQRDLTINVCTVRRATVLVLKSKAEIVEHGDDRLRSERMALDRPVVIRLITYVRVPRDVHRRKITRKAVLARDSWTCQYCGQRKPGLTVDHVILEVAAGPRRGTTSSPRAHRAIVARATTFRARSRCTRGAAPSRQPDGLHPDRKPQDPRVWEPYLGDDRRQ